MSTTNQFFGLETVANVVTKTQREIMKAIEGYDKETVEKALDTMLSLYNQK